jgi:hypothetical protein
MGEKKTKKKNTEKPNHKKKSIKPIKILKKLTGLFRFHFYKPETEKTEPNSNRKKNSEKNRVKPEKTELNRFEPVFIQKNRTEPKPVGLNRFRFFILKKFGLVTFFLIKI